MALPDTDLYRPLPNGMYVKNSDSSGPYVWDGTDMTLIDAEGGDGGGGGGTLSSDSEGTPGGAATLKALTVMPPVPAVVDITIASGASLSDAFDCGVGYSMNDIINPAALGTMTSMSFAFSHTLAGTYVPLRDQFGVEVVLNNMTASMGRHMPGELYGKRFLKLRRGTAAAPNTEALALTFKVGKAA